MMTLVVLTVVVIALAVAILAAYLLVTGVLLNRIAGNLDDCLQHLRLIRSHAAPVGPGLTRLNRVGGDLATALPLLYDAVEGTDAAGAAPVGVGYMDVPAQAAPASREAAAAFREAAPAPVVPAGVGYLDV